MKLPINKFSSSIEINVPQSFKKYETISSLLVEFTCVTEDELKNIEFNDDISYKEFEESIKKQGIWGFIDNDNVVHFWNRRDVPFDMVLAFVSHEIGHMNGIKFKNIEEEENKANTFDSVALYAYLKTKEILEDE